MKILVIEDAEDVAQMVCRALTHRGYECECVTDAVEGARKGREDGYGLIILDLLMPRMNGLDVAEAVRRAGRPTPILMLTGRDDDALLAGAAKHSGVTEVAYKPVELDALYETVRRMTAGVTDSK